MRIFTVKETDLERILTECIDEDTGEFNEELYETKVTALEVHEIESIEKFALSLQELTMDIFALNEKIKALEKRKKVLEKALERGKAYLSYNVKEKYNGRVTTDMVAITVRETERTVISDVDLIPSEYFRTKTTTEPDKTAIGKILKSGGAVPGAALEKNLSTTIK
jgi:hypothetical protein